MFSVKDKLKHHTQHKHCVTHSILSIINTKAPHLPFLHCTYNVLVLQLHSFICIKTKYMQVSPCEIKKKIIYGFLFVIICKNTIKSHEKRNKYINVTVVLLAIVNLTNECFRIQLWLLLLWICCTICYYSGQQW